MTRPRAICDRTCDHAPDVLVRTSWRTGGTARNASTLPSVNNCIGSTYKVSTQRMSLAGSSPIKPAMIDSSALSPTAQPTILP